MPARRKTPAEAVISAFGGVHATARAINLERERAGAEPVHFTTVSKWRTRGGNIHYRWHAWILAAARRQRHLQSDGDGLFHVCDPQGNRLTGSPLSLKKAQRLLTPSLALEDLMYRGD